MRNLEKPQIFLKFRKFPKQESSKKLQRVVENLGKMQDKHEKCPKNSKYPKIP